MHDAVVKFIEFVKSNRAYYFTKKRVLDIGSLDINGSNRGFFTDCDYTGVDVVAGPNVDVVSFAHNLPYPPGYFDVVISTEALEHDPYWFKTIHKAIELLRPGGMLLCTCATGLRAEHGTLNAHHEHSGMSNIQQYANHYHNISRDEFESAAIPSLFQSTHVDSNSEDFRFVGIKKIAMGYVIGIPTWKNPKGCLKLLKSIKEHTKEVYEVFVINDATPKGYQDVEKYCSENGFTYHINKVNSGVYHNWNLICNYTKNKFSGYAPIISNDDIILGPGWLDTLKEPMNCGYCDDQIKPCISGFNGFAWSCFISNPDALAQCGLFDEHFWYHGGDADWLLRAHYDGYEVKNAAFKPEQVHHTLNGGRCFRDFTIEQHQQQYRDMALLVQKYPRFWPDIHKPIDIGFDWNTYMKDKYSVFTLEDSNGL